VDQAKIVDHLTAADLFVLTSSYEGMPGSVLEAMACGLPVGRHLRRRHAGGRGGRRLRRAVPLVDVEALVDALHRRLADRALRMRMGAAGRDRVASKFPFEQLIAAKSLLYQDVITSRSSWPLRHPPGLSPA